jgi:hypothetical protein
VRERTPYRGKHGGVYRFCECDCGGNKEASTHNLTRGDVASCGCLRMSKSGKCSVEGCTTKAYCKGLCFKHYQRARRHDGDTSDTPRITICTMEGCGGKVSAKGLCRKHYQRARRFHHRSGEQSANRYVYWMVCRLLGKDPKREQTPNIKNRSS